MMWFDLRAAAIAGVLCVASSAALAQDKLKVAAGQRGNLDTTVTQIGVMAGLFKKHGLDVEVLWTQGSGETIQAVVSNSVDVGVGGGTIGVFSAFAKGAPIRVLGAEMTGGADLFWYVKADSPIKSLKDVDGRSIAYSTNGASTHSIVNQFVRDHAPKARTVATGNPPATLTQVMSGQIDVGWSAAPLGLEQIDKGEIRVIASGNDTSFKTQTVRLLMTNAANLPAKKPLFERFMKAYRETIEFIYSSDDALKAYADFLQIPLSRAVQARAQFYPKEGLDPDRIIGIDDLMQEAITARFLTVPLTKEQLAELIQIVPR